jgi:hypothetical protein
MRIDYDKDQLSYALANALKERDEARENLEEEIKFHHRTHTELIHTQCKILDMQIGRDEAREKYDTLATEHMLVINKLCNERDEARAAIPTGEWVAYEDHKKVHDAASRLLVAINKQLPIGSFTLILPEYYVLKDAIFGKHESK